MELLDAVVAVIGKVGGNGLGRTAIQKMIYFLKVKGYVDVEYCAYFYGPYSSDVKGTLASLVAYGFVNEESEIVSPNQRAYKYTLTQDGELLLKKKIEKEYRDEVNKIDGLVNITKEYFPTFGAVELSIPAKSIFVLRVTKKPETTKSISDTAGKLGWDVSPEQIDKSVNFLEELGLVTVTR